MERARKQEVEINRHLQLQIQTLKSPQRIAQIASSQLHMVEPTAAEADCPRARDPGRSTCQVRRGQPVTRRRPCPSTLLTPGGARFAGGLPWWWPCSRSGVSPSRHASSTCRCTSTTRTSRVRSGSTSRTLDVAAKRGEILDRNDRVLAFSADAESAYAVPSEIREPDRLVAALCGALEGCDGKFRTDLRERLGRPRAFVWVKRHVSRWRRGRLRRSSSRASASSRRTAGSTRIRLLPRT